LQKVSIREGPVFITIKVLYEVEAVSLMIEVDVAFTEEL
jgi:hypothetical protein